MNHQAHNQVFIPVTDDIIYDHPEQIEGPLVPYSAGMECHNWLTIEINPDESKPLKLAKRNSSLESSVSSRSTDSGLRLAYTS